MTPPAAGQAEKKVFVISNGLQYSDHYTFFLTINATETSADDVEALFCAVYNTDYAEVLAEVPANAWHARSRSTPSSLESYFNGKWSFGFATATTFDEADPLFGEFHLTQDEKRRWRAVPIALVRRVLQLAGYRPQQIERIEKLITAESEE